MPRPLSFRSPSQQVTHGDGSEGASGEKVVTTRSTDKGATWTTAIEVEPQAPSEYAYSTLLGAGDSRVFVLWVENSDNITEVPGVGPITRTDMLGHYWLKWSDNGGASWSDERVEVPLRATKIDRENSFNGSVMMSWNVDKGVVGRSGAVYIAISKIGTYCVNPPTSSWVLRSADLLDPTIKPSDATWATLPEGDDGIHNWDATPGIAEEPHVVPLASYDYNDDVEDALYLVFRTDDGYLGARSSVDSGLCSPGAPSAHCGAAMYVMTQLHVPLGSTAQYGWHE